MRKLLTILTILTIFSPTLIAAQVISQNQLILGTLGNNGWVVSTTTKNGAKLSASSTPYFSRFSFTQATGTTLFVTNASTTNFFGANLKTCNAGNVLTWTGGQFGCAADATGAASGSGNVSTSTADTANQVAVFTSTNATPALIGGFSTFTFASAGAKLTATNASTTALSASSVFYSPVTSALLLADANNKVGAASTQTCTNQFFRALTGAFVVTCAQVDISADTNLAATYPVILTNDTLSFPSTSTLYAITPGQILANANGIIVGVATSVPNTGLFYATSTNTFGCNTASAGQFGCLTAADWTTFNGKQAAGSYITALTGDVTASGPGSVAATLVLSIAHAWTALQTFLNASSTQISVTNKAYFGGSATTTIDSAGNIVIPSGSNLTVTGKTDGCATWATGVLNSTGVACGSGGGGGGAGGWTIIPAGIYNSTTSDQVMVGETATTSLAKFEVNGSINIPSKAGWYMMEGQLFAYASSTNADTIIGIGAGGNFATTSSNILNGGNTAVGSYALAAAIASADTNVAVGQNAMRFTKNGDDNVAVGAYTLWNNISGRGLTAVGMSSLQFNTGNYNTGLGFAALQTNTTGANNVALGTSAMFANISGTNNVAVGMDALHVLTLNSNNVAIGWQAGYNVTGYGNILIGTNANQTTGGPTSGSRNISIGNDSFFFSTTTDNQLNIGGLLFGTLPATSTQFVLPTTGGIGIGTSTPFGKFAISLNSGDVTPYAFNISSSTATATTSLFLISSTGSTTIAGVLNVGGSNATSTFGSGINIQTGCFSIAGTCVTGGGGASVSGGTTGMLTAWTSATTLTATSGPTAAYYTATSTTATSTFAGKVGIATTTPMSNSTLSVVGTTTFVGSVNHYGTTFCGTGGLYGLGLLGDEWCGDDNTDTGGVQRIVSNTNSGNKAWSGLTLNNNLADATLSHFAGIYYNSSTYNSSFFGTSYPQPNLLIYQNTDGGMNFFTGTSTLNTSGTLFPKLYIAFGTGSTNSTEERLRITAPGQIGIGTTTPFVALTIASSSGPQLALADGTNSSFAWTMRSIKNTLYIATSTALATSTSAAVTIDGTGSATPGLFVGTTTNANATIASNGRVFMTGLTTSGSAQTGYICYTAAGELIQDSAVCLVSALKFKQNIKNLDVGLEDLMMLRPVSYYKKDPLDGEDARRQMGFIADEVAGTSPALNEMLVTYDESGEIHGFRYEQLTALIVKSIQEMKVKKSMEDHWQWFVIALLSGYAIYNEWEKRKRKYE